MKHLYNWQKKAVALFKNVSFGMLNICCGGGKTLAALQLAQEKELPVIIIAPGHHLCEQWVKALKEEDPEADIWVHNRPKETKEGQKYRDAFVAWLSTEAEEEKRSA